MEERSGLVAAFSAEPWEIRVPASLATTLYRLAQIALTNVVRHAQAQHVTLELQQSDAGVVLVVRDDGIGFDVPAALARAAHGATLGLLSMQERTRLAGGELEIKSMQGRGTEIRACFPARRKKLNGCSNRM